ncbi:hypothetical protein [Porphyromonas sp. COT-239 OH1446]|uniref:hypothetical protein n=1 Tax=Porphyromonas sp. COT-239 OH1446 TaxID=1515613 RepID=UPI00052BEA8D|nr:hypothetical protein [Porphyromonas sp. COT-239 OH1446]KGN72108.1 hypothetical protein HQ37_00350 [Porphyromonas sp. COT-239 OH1446]
MAVGLVLSACSKDKDTPQPPKENFVMIDGQRLEIKSVRALHNKSRGRIMVNLQLSRQNRSWVWVDGIAAELHGKTIDLTKLNAKIGLYFYYFNGDHNIFLLNSAQGQVFDSGTLYTSVDPNTRDTEINLTNGKLTYEGKEHTVSLYYKGKADKMVGD